MIRPGHWVVALLLAGAAHALAFALLAATPAKGTAAAEGQLGVEIDLGMLGDLGQAQETEQPKEVTPPKPEPTPPPAPKPPPEPARQQAQAQIRAKPEPEPEPPREEVVPPQPTPDAAPQTEAIDTGDSDSNRSQLKQSTGVGNAATTGGQGGASTDYKAKIAAKLARYKRYPSASRRRGEEGVALLRFVVHRSGQVSDAELRESSGYPRLDRAVLQMLRDASPLPPFSDDMEQAQLTIVIPVDFKVMNTR